MQSAQPRCSSLAVITALGAFATLGACAANPAPATVSTTSSGSVMAMPAINWGPAPGVFQPGAEMAVLKGDPSKSEPFTVRLRFPDGYRIAPHTHPTDEHVTVVDGTLMLGMGATYDESAMTALHSGGTVTAPAQHPHYVKAMGTTTVQVDAVGPFVLTYVDPHDMPQPR